MNNAHHEAIQTPVGMDIKGEIGPGYERVLTKDALQFVAGMARKFEQTRQTLMAERETRQAKWDAGALPDFLPETKEIREGDWKIVADYKMEKFLLFNMADDWKEEHDLSDRYPARYADLREKLIAHDRTVRTEGGTLNVPERFK